MNELNGVLLLGRESEGAVDISFDQDRIADMRPSSTPSSPRRLVPPAARALPRSDRTA